MHNPCIDVLEYSCILSQTRAALTITVGKLIPI